MVKSIMLSLLIPLVFQQESSVEITWKDIQDVSFEESFLKEYNDWFLVPTFSDDIQKLNNRAINIKGYVIPLDLDGKEYALSAYPFSSCFFCGAAGPESVMTLAFVNGPPKAYKTDEVARFEGILTLNENNPEEFIFVMKSAIQIEK